MSCKEAFAMDDKLHLLKRTAFFLLILYWALIPNATSQEIAENPQSSSVSLDIPNEESGVHIQTVKSNRRIEGSRLLESDVLEGLESDEEELLTLDESRGRSIDTNSDIEMTLSDRNQKRISTRINVDSADNLQGASTNAGKTSMNHEERSSLLERFIDEFITNYGDHSLQAINPADYKNDSNWSPNNRVVSKTQCGGVITLNESQIITSPNYPNNYPNDARCTWTISAQLGTNFDQIQLHILDFSLEQGTCVNDYLSITDHAVGASKVFCGDKYDPLILSMSNSLTINFNSDDTIERKGFKMEVLALKTTCGGQYDINGNETFLFTTPASIVGSRCHWLITSKSAMSLELVNYFGEKALQDMLKVTTESFGAMEPFDIKKVYVSKIFSVSFAENVLRKDEFQPGAQFQVFPVKKVRLCNTTIDMKENASFIINSSKYPNGYDDNARCLITLQHDMGEEYIIKLQFIKFDIEEHSECGFDSLTIIDEGQNFNRTYCGTLKEESYRTKSQILKLYFESDSRNVFVYEGYSIYARIQRIRENKCVLSKTQRNVWTLKSPPLPYVYPGFTVCDIDVRETSVERFKIIFKKFSLEPKLPCTEGDYLSITDKFINNTEWYCGNMEGESIMTAGNNIKFQFSSDFYDSAREFEIEIRGMASSHCGGNTVLAPGTNINLRVSKNEEECAWVVKGKNSTLVLDFKRVSNVRISQTAMYNDLFSYNTRTINFIDPSDKYMVISSEERAIIQVNAYATYSECGTELEVKKKPVIVTNGGTSSCLITIKRLQNKKERLAIKYTLLSLPQITCPLKILDIEEGAATKLCSSDWKKTYITTSSEFTINPTVPSSEKVNSYMVLISPVKFTCGSTFNVGDDKIILKSKSLDHKTTCVYRFKSDGNRIALDIATSSKRALNTISVSTDGSFQSLRELSKDLITSLATTKEFLVIIEPFPRSVSFVLQVMKDLPVTDLCTTCLIVGLGSQGIVVTPTSKNLNTYPAGLSCDVKFEGNDLNRTVALEFKNIDIPLNTSLDTLTIVKEGVETIIHPTRISPLPYTLLMDTPFSVKFKTRSNNEYEGYKIGYNVLACGGIVTLKDESPTIIESPGYGNVYPTYMECIWQFEANITNISDRIQLKIKKLKLHASDKLEVIDPLYSYNPIYSFTGSVNGTVITSVGNQLRVIFKSDSRKVSDGFQFEVRPIVSGCGADIDTAAVGEGTISTLDFFPNTDYCLFRVRPSEGKVMLLEPLAKRRSESVRQIPDTSECKEGSVIISDKGFLNQGEMYCNNELLPVVMTTQDLLLLINTPALPPLEFRFRAGGCGGEINNDSPTGTLSSPNHPEPFHGPMTCTWTSRSAMLIEVKYIDLLPETDYLNLTDATRNVSLTGSTYPYYILLDVSSVITFMGGSTDVKTGFTLEYEFVDHQGVWNVDVALPAMIVGWPGTQHKPSAWHIVGPRGGKGLTIMVWAAYIPSDPECTTHFLHVGGVNEEGERVCGGAGLRTIHVYGREAILVLHTTSPLAVLAASVHVMG
ncbi:cubilin-like [Macrobrachium nipponense]|uniref:cubilin-like n=1 Tax=Macrobrachium nipponense TaxID=159736 RepID=UPI0030C8556F